MGDSLEHRSMADRLSQDRYSILDRQSREPHISPRITNPSYLESSPSSYAGGLSRDSNMSSPPSSYVSSAVSSTIGRNDTIRPGDTFSTILDKNNAYIEGTPLPDRRKSRFANLNNLNPFSRDKRKNGDHEPKEPKETKESRAVREAKAKEAERLRRVAEIEATRNEEEYWAAKKRIEEEAAQRRAHEDQMRRDHDLRDKMAELERYRLKERLQEEEKERLVREQRLKDERQRKLREEREKQARAITPEKLRELREMMRQKYELDVSIWSLRGVRRADQKVVVQKMVQADAIMNDIRAIVEGWDAESGWKDDEKDRVLEIQRRIREPGKRNWQKNPPW